MDSKLKLTATKLTFVLALLCLAMLGYAAIAYIHFSFHEVVGTPSIAMIVVRQRTGLSALAMCIGISSIVMGFAAFMIGAKGEINVTTENAWLKGALVSGVPGPFFVLCGTVITVTVLASKVTNEETVTTEHGANTAEQTTEARHGTKTTQVSRTIADDGSGVRALLTYNGALYGALHALAQTSDGGDSRHEELSYLISHRDELIDVRAKWDYEADAPTGAVMDPNSQQALVGSGGYIVRTQSEDDLDVLKKLLEALGTIQRAHPDIALPEGAMALLNAPLQGVRIIGRGRQNPQPREAGK